MKILIFLLRNVTYVTWNGPRSRSYNLIQYPFTILGKVLHIAIMHFLLEDIKQYQKNKGLLAINFHPNFWSISCYLLINPLPLPINGLPNFF